MKNNYYVTFNLINGRKIGCVPKFEGTAEQLENAINEELANQKWIDINPNGMVLCETVATIDITELPAEFRGTMELRPNPLEYDEQTMVHLLINGELNGCTIHQNSDGGYYFSRPLEDN